MEKEAQPMPENKKADQIKIPGPAKDVMSRLEDAGLEAYVVGGCVRDSLLGREPKDWDLTTNARPEQIIEIFGEDESFYENAFGTVGVKTGSEDEATALVEVTTYRTEGKYTDKRHPDKVEFTDNLEEDLARRDFTINAMAYNGKEIIDPFGGRKDLEERRIKAVGEAKERFDEDALRLMRAVRFSAQLGFEIEADTAEAMTTEASGLERVAKERIRDELGKLIMADWGHKGIELLRKHELIQNVIPELLEGVGMEQNHHHIYTVWEHNVRAFQYTCEQGYPFRVRMASLLHDVGKSRTKGGEGRDSTFYGHEAVGGRMVKNILKRLRFPRHEIDHISMLVTQHMFNSDVEGENAITAAGARRLVARVGAENMDDLFRVREADRIGSGVPKAVPYRLREFKYLVDSAMHDPVDRKQLKVDGNDLLKHLDMKPGPRLGAIIDALFEGVLDDPENNDREKLLARAQELDSLSDDELTKLRLLAKEKYDAVLAEDDRQLKERHRVQ